MAENQEQTKPKEREIPVFTVLKNNCILKNIFLLDKPPSISSSVLVSENDDQESEMEEILVVGRHPDCNIKLEHPSISRFHLRIHSKPSSRSLLVTDLSSVHGTWVSGKRIEPGVRIKVNEGDTLHLGASSRLYRLNWIPLSRAYDIDDPFVPQLDALDTVDEETEGATDQDGHNVSYRNNQGQGLIDNVEGLERLLSDENISFSMQKMSPIATQMPEELCHSFTYKEEEENNCLLEICNKENELPGSQLSQLDASVTVEEEAEGAIDKDGDSLPYRNDKGQGLGIYKEGPEQRFSNELLVLSVQKMSATAPPMPEDLYHSFPNKDELENNCSPEIWNKENELSSSHLSLIEKGNSTPQAHIPSAVSQAETTEYSGMNSEKRSCLNIWSRRGKPKSVNIATSQSGGNCARINMSSQVKSLLDENCLSESMLKNLYAVPDNDDEIFTQDKENTSPNSYLVRSLKCKFEETLKSESISNTPISSVDQDEEIFTPDKENVTPNSHLLRSMKNVVRSGDVNPNSHRQSPLKIATNSNIYQEEVLDKASQHYKVLQETLKAKSISNTPISSVDQDEEILTPDKENVTPNSHLLRSMKNVVRSGDVKHPNSYRPSPLKIAKNSNMYQEGLPTSDKASQHHKVLQETLKGESFSNTSVSSVDQDEEIFTPDKENVTPDSHRLRSMKNIRSLGEVKHPNSYRPSPLKIANNMYQEDVLLPTLDKAGQHREVLQESKSTFSVSKSHLSLKKQPPLLKATAGREPFQPLPLDSTSNHKANSITSVNGGNMRGCRTIEYPDSEYVHQSQKNATNVSKNRWTIVADTACLLSKKSRKELQLLRGLRGTTLVIPRIVVRELDCMIRRASFFSRMTEASAALNWIEECMAETTWWIHVQSSAEEGGLVPPTPPAAGSHWFSEDKSIFSVGSVPFSPYTLQELVTPTAADHILQCALFFRRIKNGQLVLLSDDVTLKIKAMAEGVICETAEEFRASLVTPFSPRFLYSNSSPIGPTWSCMDDTLLKERYYPSPSKKTPKSGESAKGLKLILLHNSNFRQMTN